MRTLEHEPDAFVIAAFDATADVTSTGGFGRAFFVFFVAADAQVDVALMNASARSAVTPRRGTTGDRGKDVAIEQGYLAS